MTRCRKAQTVDKEINAALASNKLFVDNIGPQMGTALFERHSAPFPKTLS
jgi:hypothetical protein